MDRDEQLEAALERVSQLEEDFELSCVKYAEAETEYRVRFAKAYLSADGTEKARNSEAIITVERFLEERNRTEAVKEFTREKLRDSQAAVSARQTLLKANLDTNGAFAR
jgi:hypothetical protein